MSFLYNILLFSFMNNYSNLVFWFVTGSQNLYGDDTLCLVRQHSAEITDKLGPLLPFQLICKPIVTTQEEITAVLSAASADPLCAGVITWMHTFSPSKMWINGLKALQRPVLHLHTQFNRDIPFDSINMDFMNANQSAHGDREHGYIYSRMGISRKVIAGHFMSPELLLRVSDWMRLAAVVTQGHNLKVLRLGDNMRNVAVTEGDKLEAHIRLGWNVDYYGVGDLLARLPSDSDARVDALMLEYADKYTFNFPSSLTPNVRYQARLEIALKSLLEEGSYSAFCDTFEDLTGLEQLPGLAAQRLMEQGYGFGPEGDWKIAALTRTLKILSNNSGTSLMEDYTYHLQPGLEAILGAHMLEVCPTIADSKPSIEVHPLSIGDKNPPARLVFDGRGGDAICTCLVDMGGRLRLIVLDVEAFLPPSPMPHLPVARVMWRPYPNMQDACEAWILAGGAHHTVFSYNVSAQLMLDWAEMTGIESVHIGKHTNLHSLKRDLALNELLFRRL